MYCTLVPFIPLVIVLEVLFGRNFLLVFVAIGAVSWLDIARTCAARRSPSARRTTSRRRSPWGSARPPSSGAM
jgi:oligopeptide transport system permease protein